MKSPRPLRELLLALCLLAVGLFLLPAAVYFVGQEIIGPYEAGLLGFYDAIGNALLAGSPYAWILVLSPCLAIQLFRLVLWMRRHRRPVNQVTNS